jgi:hypothetical protein
MRTQAPSVDKSKIATALHDIVYYNLIYLPIAYQLTRGRCSYALLLYTATANNMQVCQYLCIATRNYYYVVLSAVEKCYRCYCKHLSQPLHPPVQSGISTTDVYLIAPILNI